VLNAQLDLGDEPESETPITRAVLVAVSALPGALFYRQNTGTFRTLDGRRVVKVAPTGIGDIMGGYWGRAVAIETKTATGKLRISQKRFRAAWERAGNTYIVAQTPEEAVEALHAIHP
jgi:hypothetical protein